MILFELPLYHPSWRLIRVVITGFVVSQEDERSPLITGLSFEEAFVSRIVKEEGSNPSKEDM